MIDGRVLTSFRWSALLVVLATAMFAGRNETAAAPGDHLWSGQFGAPGWAHPYSVATDADGNVLLVGEFAGTTDFGGGPLVAQGNGDIFVAKLDGDGTHLWSKRFGDGMDIQQATDVATDSAGNVVVTGLVRSTVDFGGGPLAGGLSPRPFLVKFDPAGNHVWSQHFVTTGYGPEIAVDGGDNIVMTGAFRETVDFGGGVLTAAGSTDVFIAKFDANGVPQWSERFGDARQQYGSDITTDSSGSIIVTGTFIGTIDLGGGPFSTNYVGPEQYWYDFFLAKFTADGAHVWSAAYGDDWLDYASSVATTAAGEILLTGSFQGAIDFGGGPLSALSMFVVKFDANGDHIWSKEYGSGFTRGLTIDVAATGNVLVGAWFEQSVDFGGGPIPGGHYDMAIASLDGDGNHLWSRGFGELNTDGDSCTDGSEAGPNHQEGGQRNREFPYDFYDVDATRKVDSVDIALVRANFNPFGPVPPEDVIYDRSPGVAPWAPGAPDGRINGIDIALVRASFNDYCGNGFFAYETPEAITADGAGDVFVGGLFHDSIDVGGGAYVQPIGGGGLIVKFDGTP